MSRASLKRKARTGNRLYVLTFVTFLILRLTHVTHWSWWWVTAPLWIWTAFFFTACGLIVCLAVLADE